MNNYGLRAASIDFTYKCNFRCKHCFNSSGEHNFNKEELSKLEILNIVEQLSELKLESICFCGGEALLKKDIVLDAAKLLKEKNSNKLSINMVSNGYMITENVALELKKAGIRLIQISLDGAKASTHDWLRNMNGSYEKAINAIKILVDKKFYVGVAFTPTKRNIHEIDDLINLCENLGVNELRVQPIMKLGRAKNIQDEFLEYIDYFKLGNKLKKANITSKMRIEWGDPLQHIIGGRHEIPKINYLTISAYGDLLVSPYLPITFGNIRRHSIKEYINKGLLNVWNFEFLRKLSKLIDSTETLDISDTNSNIPPIFSGNDIDFDIIDNNTKLLNDNLIKRYNL
ncbi:radical SAM protein [Clostridium perfringens]|uniref:radical SAM protein n=2 Tax=Clostridium perfringens TaxID=1502 RepID=UPI001314D39A|nr:radical SAM protein [Clostridium perfringens]HAT4117239.1 radical SAM protein [Clostridium perfringens]HBC2031672.1 radical SAM protein [Clostridium perfringens]HBC2035031.1 radical SAM protein [Clostridium perfringens]HBC2058194.1 radical SAM protein [Clostridium perfringens]HBC2072417.1 radical SAM protein [Clostridium perfringens]